MLEQVISRLARQRNSWNRNKPIDVVYTWVDGADPDFQRELQRHASAGSSTAASGARRFRDSDELRYSLRSLEAHVPWTGRVFLVTNGQVPRWLKRDHPRLRLVRHEEIFPDHAHLPTFNSAAIETHLHRIPDLSRCFLYLNDDVFFGRPISLDHFLAPDGRPRLWVEKWELPFSYTDQDDLAIQWLGHARRLLEAERKLPWLAQPAHGPVLLDRELLARMESHWAAEFARTSAARFRIGDMAMPFVLYPHWLAARDRCELAVAGPELMQFVMIQSPAEKAIGEMEIIRRERPVCFCLNDDWDDDLETKTQIVSRFLQDYFPQPSSFESRLSDSN